MLTAERLLSAEVGSRLLLIRIHDLCRYARGELPPKWLQLSESLEGNSSARWFENTTFLPARELSANRDDQEHCRIANYALNALELEHEQELAMAISGTLQPIVYREHYHYPTTFKAANSIAVNINELYNGFGIGDFEWDAKSESERVSDCIEFRQWIDAHLPPTFLWSVYQRIEQERLAYLAWRDRQGKPLKYPAQDFHALPGRLSRHLGVNPHVILFGESVFEREVDCWPRTLQRSHEELAGLRADYGLADPTSEPQTMARSIRSESEANDRDFIEGLLVGPDDAELSPRELALLDAHLAQPVSLAAIQQEKQATGESETNSKRNKLKLIRDFNRNLQTTQTSKPTAAAGAAIGDTPEPIARTASGSVLLFAREDCPLVKGIEKPTLTNAQYDVVLALLQSGDKGLTKDKLDRESGRGDARKILKRLSDSDSDWESAISFPGTTGKGYRIT